MSKITYIAQDRENAIDVKIDERRGDRRVKAMYDDINFAGGGVTAAVLIEGLNRLSLAIFGLEALKFWSLGIIIATIVALVIINPIRESLWGAEDAIRESEKPHNR